MGLEIKNTALARVISESMDTKFPVKLVATVPTIDTTKYYTSAEIIAMFPTYAIRYIDFVSGADGNNGLTAATAWQHLYGATRPANCIYFIVSAAYGDGTGTWTPTNTGNYVIAGLMYGAKTTNRTTFRDAVRVGHSFGGTDYINKIYSFNLDFDGSGCTIQHNLTDDTLFCLSCTFKTTGNYVELMYTKYCYVFSDVDYLGFRFGNGQNCVIKNTYLARFWTSVYAQFAGFWKYALHRVFFDEISTPPTFNLTLPNDLVWQGVSTTDGLVLAGYRITGSLLCSGGITGDKTKIDKLIEEVPAWNDDFTNQKYADFNIRGSDIVYRTIDNIVSIDTSDFRLSPSFDMINKLDYQDDADSLRAVFSRIAEKLSVSFQIPESDWRDNRYRDKLKKGYYLVSDDNQDRTLSITKQYGNYVQFGSVQATDYGLIGYVGYCSASSLWILIDGIVSYNNGTTTETYYYVRTINAAEEKQFSFLSYVGSSFRITWRIMSLLSADADRVMFNLLRITLIFSEKLFVASGDNIFLEGE